MGGGKKGGAKAKGGDKGSDKGEAQGGKEKKGGTSVKVRMKF